MKESQKEFNKRVHQKVTLMLTQRPELRSPTVTYSASVKNKSKGLLVKHNIGKIAIIERLNLQKKIQNELGL